MGAGGKDTSQSAMGKQHPWKPLTDEVVKEGLEFVLARSNHPVLVCCTSGIHETGAFVGCLRRLLAWNFNSIVVEYRCFAGSKARSLIQQFIELFDTDLVTVSRTRHRKQDLPCWYLEYMRSAEEEKEESK
ncbi:hypothetical protein HK100_006559 [Physocladia obscura]|uniref:Uncharacterized protein n=1 Tax=Physocladia obscura TaxID=109957 RepID=A0AAD5XCK5_9FUNG|nr:hypothetical protein HK100_006559 [Physocladia obscura]